MNPLLELSDATLLRLAQACEHGRLEIGNTLERSRRTIPETVAAELERLLSGGISQPHIAYLLRTIVASRDASDEAKVALVWTGSGHTAAARDTAVVVRELFASARQSVLVVGFAVHRGREIFKELAARMADEPGLEVRMFLNIARALRDTTTTEQLVARFVHEFRREHWSGRLYPTIYYDPRALALGDKKRTSLHAKCIVIDRKISLVTSANFTEAAQERNIEAGDLVNDEIFSRVLVGQFDTLIATGAVARLPLG